MRLVGVPPSPGLAALRPVERTCRCGSMLRMTSRERVTRQRHEGIAAKRRKRPGAVTNQRSRSRPRRARGYIAAGKEVRRSPQVLGSGQLNQAHEVRKLTHAGSPERLPRARITVRPTVLSPAGKKRPAWTQCAPGWIVIHCFCLLRDTSLFGIPRYAYFCGANRWKKNKDKPETRCDTRAFRFVSIMT